MCKWRIANHCVSINDPKTHCGKHFFSLPIDPWFVLTLGKLAAVCGAGEGGAGVYCRKPLIDPLALFRVILFVSYFHVLISGLGECYTDVLRWISCF